MIRSEVLPSGLRLVTEPMADVRSATVGFWVGTGSRDETDEQSGVSHFLEHLLFKGTDTRSAEAIAEAVDEVGGDFNAFTAKEYTSFYIRLLAEDLALGLDILSDIMWQPALRSEDVEAERHVILDEILMHADEPADLAGEQCLTALFPGHALGREVLGTAESVAAIDPDTVRRFFEHHYRPGNMVVAVAGDIDHEEVAADIQERFAGTSDGVAPERSAPDRSTEPLLVTTRATEQAHLVFGIRSSGRHDEARWSLAVLNHVLGGGLSSRLFQEIRERRGLAYSVWSDRSAYQEVGSLMVGAGTAPEHVEEVLTIIADELASLGESGITERELAVAKGNLRAETLLACEDSGARMGRIGASQLLYGEVLTIDELLAKVEAVTLDDVHEVAKEALHAPRVLAAVGPFEADAFDTDRLGLGSGEVVG